MKKLQQFIIVVMAIQVYKQKQQHVEQSKLKAQKRLCLTLKKPKIWTILADADAIIFGSPTYMSSASTQFKASMDASSKVQYTRDWKDKIAAGFTTSASKSGDKLNMLVQLAVFAAQHGMIWVGQDLMPGTNSTTESVNNLNKHGGFLGAVLQANSDQGPDVASIAKRLNA